MKCEICSASAAKGAALYRANKKGENGVWRCIVHVDTLPDNATRRLVETIQDGIPYVD
jgi:hypothetical protein